MGCPLCQRRWFIRRLVLDKPGDQVWPVHLRKRNIRAIKLSPTGIHTSNRKIRSIEVTWRIAKFGPHGRYCVGAYRISITGNAYPRTIGVNNDPASPCLDLRHGMTLGSSGKERSPETECCSRRGMLRIEDVHVATLEPVPGKKLVKRPRSVIAQTFPGTKQVGRLSGLIFRNSRADRRSLQDEALHCADKSNLLRICGRPFWCLQPKCVPEGCIV
jgi:hypothetical protein